jgi:hypothetical protein
VTVVNFVEEGWRGAARIEYQTVGLAPSLRPPKTMRKKARGKDQKEREEKPSSRSVGTMWWAESRF